MTNVSIEQSSYWRDYFITLDKTPLSLAIWRGIFDDSELCEFSTLPKESLEDALQRHRRKLEAMLQALEEINLPELEWLPPKVRQQLEM
ncbi:MULTISPECIES: hypothetical protein [Pseudomonas syringae group]|uniref:hypothetical protein n=1 Tax=Pseudomonas syringae group TaxID=136849 RepID=UPI0006D5F766|nr:MULTISPECIES: hypothetical protein [Pseudomonas syringae group]KAA8712524.1 hypothetical protein F4W70_11050 [Pseudomonas cannabina]TKJ56749.1 hypothetical protein PviCFBP13507_24415 [Pseudomonas viridiflava]TKK29104.1 hypothetical protein PviCFBP13515_09290 [Pseudomonas viridiflava]SDR33492.1 hypothetical protein SAMN05216597_3715 [Pseudomonas cannabina]